MLFSLEAGADGTFEERDGDHVPPIVAFPRGATIRRVACGESHSAALAFDGSVFTWGSEQPSSSPTLVRALSAMPCLSLACGARHTLVATTAGHVYSWGSNAFGQLGLGTMLPTELPGGGLRGGEQRSGCDQLEPQRVVALAGCPVSNVACGAYHSVVLASDGSVWSFGWGRFGQLGDEELGDGHVRATPVCIRVGGHGIQQVESVCCGAFHTLALTTRGSVLAWGCNASGQLGLGTSDDCARPTEIIGPLEGRRTEVVCAGGSASCALDSEGKAWVWGRAGAHSQLEPAALDIPFALGRVACADAQWVALSSHRGRGESHELVRWDGAGRPTQQRLTSLVPSSAAGVQDIACSGRRLWLVISAPAEALLPPATEPPPPPSTAERATSPAPVSAAATAATGAVRAIALFGPLSPLPVTSRPHAQRQRPAQPGTQPGSQPCGSPWCSSPPQSRLPSHGSPGARSSCQSALSEGGEKGGEGSGREGGAERLGLLSPAPPASAQRLPVAYTLAFSSAYASPPPSPSAAAARPHSPGAAAAAAIAASAAALRVPRAPTVPSGTAVTIR
ncbi:regulator of chromosome condensation 1/beta-lactamase-inhibitor protein II [Pavlovales sp. CCMP2436]|nr:regulator of chromosome condensation 1/beta-lactamase-inhibitor protein II [Pavlovales sp. CCMP2436]